jgi:hypothetical protein
VVGALFEERKQGGAGDRQNAEALSKHLCQLPEVLEFHIAPTGD